MSSLAIEFADVQAAAQRISTDVVYTPLLTSRELDDRSGASIFVKAENLQRTGSFKFRGAMNRIASLNANERRSGVIAFSSGNHALAVSEAAMLAGIPAVVVMPKDAPRIKIEGARARGAEVILYDRDRDDREAIGRSFAAQRGMTLISPFDDPYVIAGQGTAALEVIEQLRRLGKSSPDLALICCSGGGLAAGWAVALKHFRPDIEIVTVEPEQFDDTARSLVCGKWCRNDRSSGSICDALQMASPGQLTLPILLQARARGITVSDEQVRAAVRFAIQELKLVLEPGGAVALAAILSSAIDTRGRTVLISASGGNTDLNVLADCVGARELAPAA